MNEGTAGIIGRFDMDDLDLAVAKTGKEDGFVEPDCCGLEQWRRSPSHIDVGFSQKSDPDQPLADDDAPVP